MTLYIVRHGQTIWNLEGRKQGFSDSPLTLQGIKQAENIADLLRIENLNYDETSIFVSPLFRTQQYAQILLEVVPIIKKPCLEPLIKEHAFGAWEGLTQNEVDEQFPGETEKRMQNRWQYIIPGGGESYELISKRVSYFLDKNRTEENMLIICHEMISKVMRGILLGLSEEETLELGHPQDTIYKFKDGKIEDLS